MACSRAPEPRTNILTGSGYPANAIARTRRDPAGHRTGPETADWEHGTSENR